MGSNDHPQPWISVTADEAAALRQRADLEIAPGHQLHGLTIEADARCVACEAVAFRVEDGTFALVTLGGDGPESPPTVRARTRIDFELALEAHHH